VLSAGDPVAAVLLEGLGVAEEKIKTLFELWNKRKEG
jgi:hypothetical protein